MCHVPLLPRLHFCTPAVARVAASATFPLTAGVTSVPSPSSQTYSVFALANHIPNGNARGFTLVSVFGNPGRIVIGSFSRLGGVPGAFDVVGRTPAVPTWYTVLTPLLPLPLVTYNVLSKIVR